MRKGEKGTMVVYADTYIPKAEREKAASGGPPRRVAFLKRHTVFHVSQCDGLPEEMTLLPAPGRSEVIPNGGCHCCDGRCLPHRRRHGVLFAEPRLHSGPAAGSLFRAGELVQDKTPRNLS